MRQATRRGFLRATSMGAAAAGVLAALPTFVFAQDQTPAGSSGGSPMSQPTMPMPMPMTGGAAGGASAIPFTVLVNGPKADAVIYVGEREIPITDASVIQYLRQIAATA